MPGARKSLGEIALRVNDIDRMSQFYQNVINLELMSQSPKTVFFKIDEGLSGHTQVLALFDRSMSAGYIPPGRQHSPMDHLAFSMGKQDFETEKTRLLEMGCELKYAYHDWVKWRSLYLLDPEGNTVEFVCYDPDSSRPIEANE